MPTGVDLIEHVSGTLVATLSTVSDVEQAPKLMEQVRQAIRVRHYSRRTEEAYVTWIRRFIVFHGRRHPSELGAGSLSAFLSSLATERRVSASTQNQALSALLFLYRSVLGVQSGRSRALSARRRRPGCRSC